MNSSPPLSSETEDKEEQIRNLLEQPKKKSKKKISRRTKEELEFEQQLQLITASACVGIEQVLDTATVHFLKIRPSTSEELSPRAEQLAKMLNFYLATLMQSKFAPLVLYLSVEGISIANRLVEKKVEEGIKRKEEKERKEAFEEYEKKEKVLEDS